MAPERPISEASTAFANDVFESCQARAQIYFDFSEV
jgi:hypothetical protein